jgi:glycosyltransferase involved in cell wall biosynthesis
MNILFLVYHGLHADSGISKKILSQVKGLKEAGHEVATCTYFIDGQGHRVREIDGQRIADYGRGRLAPLRKRCSYGSIARWAIAHGTDLVYVRSFHNANPFTIGLFRRLKAAGIRVVMEIPTYPYDAEYANFPLFGKLELWVDKLFRHRLARTCDAIVTFTSEPRIFGQRTICISNGVDFSALPLHHSLPHPRPQGPYTDELHLIGVAEVHYWHGFDRLLRGLEAYYRTERDVRVVFHLVGGMADAERYGSRFAEGILTVIEQAGLQEVVKLHGPLHGEALDAAFAGADMAVGSLARHRTGITRIKTLKNREYAARGIPFIYSEEDEDFDAQPYVLKVPADETPIRIEDLVEFYTSQAWDSAAIRRSVEKLTWKVQMQKVVEAL